MKILYAEDERHLSRVIAAILVHNGYEVDAVYDGKAALELALNNDYDIFVLDIMMPEMSGLEVVRSIRAAEIGAPVILLTAKAELEDRINGLDAGANDYLTKPFASEELLARIRAHTRGVVKEKKTVFEIGNITVDTKKLELKNESAALRLDNQECTMLEMLITDSDFPISPKLFHHKIWNDVGDVLVVKMYISYLNKKLKSLNATVFVDDDGGYKLKELADYEESID